MILIIFELVVGLILFFSSFIYLWAKMYTIFNGQKYETKIIGYKVVGGYIYNILYSHMRGTSFPPIIYILKINNKKYYLREMMYRLDNSDKIGQRITVYINSETERAYQKYIQGYDIMSIVRMIIGIILILAAFI